MIQRKEYFHELGHIKTQDGRQDKSLPIQADYLENTAERFAYNASMPRHLVEKVIKKSSGRNAVSMVTNKFIVPYGDAEKRVQQIRRDKQYMWGMR
ncbi:ImmA/IrrE family metallo-endopeptidase [Geomicrobium sp. JCM 19039]|uniref:ImmA/IrrE family metallo-endopeptidase n=1 Tax=Geomicrobium sp. JCM 19039 TaxID=1460636 RepID=UPI001268C6BF